MTGVVTSIPVKSVELHATIARCGCTEEQKTDPHWHGAAGMPCPQPRVIEDKGCIAEWHNPAFKE